MTTRHRIPVIRPRPARLSTLKRELEEIEASGIFSNYGPVNARFEAELTRRVFGGHGGALTVANATLGLLLAIREVASDGPSGRYVVMPSFTFAASAQAALWCGFTPLFCDVDRDTWLPATSAEEELLSRYPGEIACIVTHATFGNCPDLDRYARLSADQGIGVVIDAAAGLGTIGPSGQALGTGSPHAVVFSMHVTKAFATSEGGVIYCADPARLARLRQMANYGFDGSHVATVAGLNAKLSEVAALLALAKLDEMETLSTHRAGLAARYRELLPELTWQKQIGRRLAYAFMPGLLPVGYEDKRDEVIRRLAAQGVDCAHYFSPHLLQHPYFARVAVSGDLAVTDSVAARAISLPMADDLGEADVAEICGEVRSVIAQLA